MKRLLRVEVEKLYCDGKKKEDKETEETLYVLVNFALFCTNITTTYTYTDSWTLY